MSAFKSSGQSVKAAVIVYLRLWLRHLKVLGSGSSNPNSVGSGSITIFFPDVDQISLADSKSF